MVEAAVEVVVEVTKVAQCQCVALLVSQQAAPIKIVDTNTLKDMYLEAAQRKGCSSSSKWAPNLFNNNNHKLSNNNSLGDSNLKEVVKFVGLVINVATEPVANVHANTSTTPNKIMDNNRFSSSKNLLSNSTVKVHKQVKIRHHVTFSNVEIVSKSLAQINTSFQNNHSV